MIGAIFGAIGNRKADKKAEKYYRAGLGYLSGDYSLKKNAYDQVQMDPRTREGQLAAMRGLLGAGQSKGMDIASRATQAQAMNEAQRQYGMNDAAIAEGARRRNQGGSGASLAAQLMNSSTAAQRNAMIGTQSAGDARSRALQALSQGGQFAGQARGQDWQEASTKAQAANAIAQFNKNMLWDQARGKAGLTSDRGQQAVQSTKDLWAGIGTGVTGAIQAGVGALTGNPMMIAGGLAGGASQGEAGANGWGY